MAIIKGSHGRPLEPIAASVQDIENPNHSFRFLTIDTTKGAPAPDPNSLQPADDTSKTIKALIALADQMFEESDTTANKSTIPPVYTYWGQFIDHDVTAGTDRSSNSGHNILTADITDNSFAPHKHKDVENGIVNVRLPLLDLDSVYGGEDGPDTLGVPEEGIYADDNIHLRVGENQLLPGFSVPPAGDNAIAGKRDLPRRQANDDEVPPERVGEARIGDGRNDENLVVAQFHTAFLHFHNKVVDSLTPTISQHELFRGLNTFGIARQIVCWTYQWLVVEDYLKTIAKEEVVDELLEKPTHFFTDRESLFMPLEYSVAGFRFGHTMVRADYDYNLNFTMRSPKIGAAGLNELFQFTFGGNLGGEFPPSAGTPRTSKLVDIWIIDWDRFTDKESTVEQQFARKIDTNLAMPLGDLRNVDPTAPDTDRIAKINRNLARRNLLRGYLLNLPTGQHVAQWLGAPVLQNVAPEDKPNVKKVLEDSGLDKRTPLWYYILREAELGKDKDGNTGNQLGEAGSRLVAGTIISMLKADPDSYLSKGWSPTHETAMKLPGDQPITKIMDFFRFAGVAPKVPVAAATGA